MIVPVPGMGLVRIGGGESSRLFSEKLSRFKLPRPYRLLKPYRRGRMEHRAQ